MVNGELQVHGGRVLGEMVDTVGFCLEGVGGLFAFGVKTLLL